MNKFTRLVAGLTCIAAIGASFAGCGAFMEGFKQGLQDALGGSNLQADQVEEMNVSVMNMANYTGSYSILETNHVNSSIAGKNTIELTYRDLTYNADTYETYYHSTIPRAMATTDYIAVEYELYTKNNTNSFTQYVKTVTRNDNMQKTKKTLSDLADLEENGEYGIHALLNQRVVYHFPSLKDAISAIYLLDLDEAKETTSAVAYTQFWANTYYGLIEQSATDLGVAIESVSPNGSRAFTSGEETVYEFKVKGTGAAEQLITDYTVDFSIGIHVNADGRITTIDCDVLHEFKMAGEESFIKIELTDRFAYEYDTSLIPSDSDLANWS